MFTCLPPPTWVSSLKSHIVVSQYKLYWQSSTVWQLLTQQLHVYNVFQMEKKRVVSFFFSLRDLYQSQIGQRIIHKEYVSFWIGSVQISIILDTKIKLHCLIVEDTLPPRASPPTSVKQTRTPNAKKWHYARQNPANLTVTDLIPLKAVQLNVSLLCAFTGGI